MSEKKKTALFDPQIIRLRQEANPFAKISDIIYDVLAEAILASRIEPGSKLNVSQIAEKLGVSNTPVCRAIDRLQENGLVTALYANEGKYRNYYVFDLNDESLANLFVARKAIEGAAAAICAEKNALLDMEKIRRSANEFQQAWQDFARSPQTAPDVSERARIDRDFHSLLVMQTDNKYLIDMFESIQGTVGYLSIRTCEFVATEQRKNNFLIMGTHHNTVCQAIESGMPELASAAMERHLDFCCHRCLMDRAAVGD